MRDDESNSVALDGGLGAEVVDQHVGDGFKGGVSATVRHLAAHTTQLSQQSAPHQERSDHNVTLQTIHCLQ